MRTFQYKGYDAQGRTSRGLIEAPSDKSARERLAAQGILVEKLGATGRVAVFSRMDRAMFYHELGALLDAGVPMVAALDLLITSPEHVATRNLVAALRDRVRDGEALSDALDRVSRAVQPFERAVLDAGARAGTVAAMLRRLAVFLEAQETLRARVQSALIYPAIVVAMGIVVGGVMLGVLLPKAREFLGGSSAQLPWLTRALLAGGGVATGWGGVALFCLLAAAGVLGRRALAQPRHAETWDRLLFRLPVAGRGYALLVCQRFAHTLAALCGAGVSLVDGLRMAGQSTGSRWVAGLAERESEAVRHGERLSDAVAKIPPLAASLPGWIRIGESGGGLTELLERAAERYEGQWERFVGRSIALLEPLLIVLIGGFVLTVALGVLLPVLEMTRVLGK